MTASTHHPSVIPTTILTGFLGSGKTTLLNRILAADHGFRVGVLVNDFGAVNIDIQLVDSLDADSVSLTNGCICCTMRGDLVQNILRMLRRPLPPEYILVEASGVSDPIAISSAFKTSVLSESTYLDGIIALVDAENVSDPRLDAQLIHDQIRAADIVLLNKVDLVDMERRNNLHHWIMSLVPEVRVMDTVNAEVPLGVLLGAGQERVREIGSLSSSTPHSHDHGTLFHSHCYSTDRPLSYRAARAAFETLPPAVFRAKGILWLADAPLMRFVAHKVGRRTEIDVAGRWGDETPKSELVLIGAAGALSADRVQVLFDACVTDSIPLMSRQNLITVMQIRRSRRSISGQ